MRVVSDADVIIHLAKLNELKLLNKLKASEFRIHPNIIDHAVDRFA